ncbi:MAG: riboflavin biosynthesis protein RibF [Phycisphaerae bacterium]
MLLIHHASEFPPSARNAVLCVGNFDGVHLGHQRMLSEGQRQAREKKLSFVIMTFDPHPMTVLRPGQERLPLMTTAQRLEMIQQYQPDVLWLVKTDPAFLHITAEEFMRDSMAHTIGAKMIVEGRNFTFGKGAQGTVSTLRDHSQQWGWETSIIRTRQAVLRDLSLVDVSSSLVRWLIGQGRVSDARRLLGRYYSLRGRVEHGAGRGTMLGYPTLNIKSEQLLPASGVYAGQAVITGRNYPAAISVGSNPTFNGTATTVEAFVLDFSGSVYDQEVELQFIRWLRDQYTFSGPEALAAQIQRDVEEIRLRLTPDALGLEQENAGAVPNSIVASVGGDADATGRQEGD